MPIKRSVLYILLVIGLLLLGSGVWLLFNFLVQQKAVPSPEVPEVAFFPVQKAGYEVLPYPSALATGTLVLDNGYLRLIPGTDPAYTGESLLIIWPPGSTLQVEKDIVQILNKEGKPIARVGEILKIGGGEVPTEIVTKYTGQTLPPDCPGPYWLAAPGVYNTPLPTLNITSPNPEEPVIQIEPALGTALMDGIYLEQAAVSVGVLERSGRNGWRPELYYTSDPCLVITGTLRNDTDKDLTVNFHAEGYDISGTAAAWTLDIDPGPLAGIAQKDVLAHSYRDFTLHLSYADSVTLIKIAANFGGYPPKE